MNERQREILDSINSNAKRRRRWASGKVDAVNHSLRESTIGARPSDDMDFAAEEPAEDDFAPVAGSLEGPQGESEEITQEGIDAAVERAGFKPVTIDDLDMEELKKGAEVEKEHTDDIMVAATIAAHHLHEHAGYYPALEKMEKELEHEQSETPEQEKSEQETGDEDEGGSEDDDFEEIEIDLDDIDDEGEEDESEDDEE